MNVLDATLQAACPCVMCPRYEPLTFLEGDSHRFLVASDGLYVEVRRPWIHAILKVVDSPIPLPYGQPPRQFSINLHRSDLVGPSSCSPAPTRPPWAGSSPADEHGHPRRRTPPAPPRSRRRRWRRCRAGRRGLPW